MPDCLDNSPATARSSTSYHSHKGQSIDADLVLLAANALEIVQNPKRSYRLTRRCENSLAKSLKYEINILPIEEVTMELSCVVPTCRDSGITAVKKIDQALKSSIPISVYALRLN
jgi:hypothetical protein